MIETTLRWLLERYLEPSILAPFRLALWPPAPKLIQQVRRAFFSLRSWIITITITYNNYHSYYDNHNRGFTASSPAYHNNSRSNSYRMLYLRTFARLRSSGGLRLRFMWPRTMDQYLSELSPFLGHWTSTTNRCFQPGYSWIFTIFYPSQNPQDPWWPSHAQSARGSLSNWKRSWTTRSQVCSTTVRSAVACNLSNAAMFKSPCWLIVEDHTTQY